MRSLCTAALLLMLVLLAGTETVLAQPQSLVPPDGFATTLGAEIAADHSTAAVGGAVGECSFKYGNLHFSCIIPYVGYLIKIVIYMGAGICLFSIVLGGYKIAVGTIVEAQKEEGKRAIVRALVGFTIAIFSYFLVNTVIQALAP